MCGCGCGNVIPDVVMLALDSRFNYGGNAHRQATLPDALCPALIGEAARVDYQRAA
jgi:hypothetical protein